MDAVTLLRLLWRQRLLMAVGLVVALVVGIILTYKVSPGLPPAFESRQYQVGIASAGVLVDSPSSQTIDLSGGQSKADVASLSARARLLANLIATSPLKDQIARRARIPVDTMIAAAPTSDGIATKPSPLATGETKVRATDPEAHVLTVYVNEALPIITADAQAPTPAIAARISSAAVAELSLYLQSVAAADRVPDARQLVVKPLGPAKSATVQRGPRRLLSIMASLFVFGLWAGGIVLVSSLARGWRAVSEAEGQAPGERPVPGPRVERMPATHSDAPVTRPPPGGVSARPESVPDLPERPERPMRVA